MTAREWISENYDWDRSGRGYIAKKDGRLYLISDVAEAYSQAENERLRDQFIEMLSTFGLHRPADKETGPWYRGECHPNCKACDMINAIRSQAATERGEPHAKS